MIGSNGVEKEKILEVSHSCYIITTTLPFIVSGTAKAAAACILILKLEESRSSNKRILNTEEDLQNMRVKSKKVQLL